MWILIIWCFGVPGSTDNAVSMATATFHSKQACVAAANDLTDTSGDPKKVMMAARCYEDTH